MPEKTGTRELINAEAEASPDWVTSLSEASETDQLFVVAAYDKSTAWVSMHQKDDNGDWKMIMSTPGYIGRDGTCPDEEHVERLHAQTPLGVYHFNKAFGIADAPGCSMEYTKVNDDIYWSSDVREGMHYNEMVDINDCPDLDTDNCEHIIDYTYQYQYCLNISFNEGCTPGRGSALV